MANEEKKVLLSIKDLIVKFRVRGRILTAIRGISLDIYENESIAIVGESGSGKSVFTKTFAGMLDSNGFIDGGEIIFNDEELANTSVTLNTYKAFLLKKIEERLHAYASLEGGADIYRQIAQMKSDRKIASTLKPEEEAAFDDRKKKALYVKTEAFNKKMTLDPKTQKAQIKQLSAKIKDCDNEITAIAAERRRCIKSHAQAIKNDENYLATYAQKMAQLEAAYEQAIKAPVSDEVKARNAVIAKEILLSIGRCSLFARIKFAVQLLGCMKKAMRMGVDLSDEKQRNSVFEPVTFRVRYVDESCESIAKGKEKVTLNGTCIINLAKVKLENDWMQIRGKRISTVFQDPMTSLNPIITIGKQITSIIIKHQHCSEAEARERAIILMKKVGIPNAEKRFDDYPFQYSGGMRQRIVIAIALSCQPKILICDEPTTALDVTIQAQILRLIKSLQKEFGFTIVFITHDLGVVANIADRVAVLYAGQVVELGNVDEVFYDPRHPYTWAMLSSMPQLAQRNTTLYSIFGTPPSLYNEIVGDPFAPRNPYCLKIDTLKDSPMFKVTDTHYAKTWLLDPRAPKLEKPEIISNIHEKLTDAFNI